ncbi:MAG: hypothetical protein ACXAAN_11905, partial [Candidatus Thorarchaeota archaeon]
KEYYNTLDDLHDYYRSRTLRDSEVFELGDDERRHIERNNNHLIIWTDNTKIVGHNIWHETTTDEMTQGEPRDDDDRGVLRELFGGAKGNLVELHELWLGTQHRGNGYGNQFFDFFEGFVSQSGFDGILHYTDHAAVIVLCRKRGYKEAFLEGSGWYVFALQFPLIK